jgi:hypothetical protein
LSAAARFDAAARAARASSASRAAASRAVARLASAACIMAVYTRAAAQVRKRSSCFKYVSTDIIVSTNVRSYLSKTND